MKQYCRYCEHGNWYDDYVFCGIKNKLISEQKAKAVNKCKDFAFCKFDVYDHEKIYKPRVEKAAEVNSDSQLYKQAGNSVTVNVIYEIAKRLKDE